MAGRSDRIEKRGSAYVVLSGDGSRVLGEHDTEQAAKDQLAAIESRKDGAVQRVRRYDKGTLHRARRDARGFLHVPASLTRAPAVFPYRQADGTIRREFRPPEHVFSNTNMDSVRGAPVTDEHPRVPVTTRNASRFQAGHATGEVTRDGDLMQSDLVVTNDDLSEKMERGDARECSLGYECDLVFQAGTWTDERGVRHDYDAIQTNHRTNHIAIVPQGRAGPSVRAHLDSTDAEQITGEQITMTTKTDDKSKQPVTREDFLSLLGGSEDKARVKVDGVEYELPTATAQAIATKQARDANELATEKARADKAEADLVAMTKERDDEKKRADEAEGGSTHDAVEARIKLLEKARPHFKADEFKDLRTKSDAEIRKATVAKVYTDADLEGKSTDWVDALFTHIKSPKKDKAVQNLGNHILDSDESNAPDENDTEAIEKKIDSKFDADSKLWQRPVPGGYTKTGPTPTNDHYQQRKQA